MKNIFIVASVLILGLFTFQNVASAQVMPDYLSYCHGEFYDQDGYQLSHEEIAAVIGGQVYHDTYLGAIKQRRAGKTLITIGAPCFVGGIALLVAGSSGAFDDGCYDYDYCDEWGGGDAAAIICGYLVALGGITCLEIGIPLAAIGSSRLRWIANDYNENAVSTHKKYAATLTPYSGKYGTGLALNF